MFNPTPDSLKQKAKVIRKFINQKCNVNISHSHCIELVSQIFGFKDWNTASAALKLNGNQNALPAHIKTVGDMKKALESFEESTMIDASYEFKLGDFLDELDPFERPEDTINQEFSFVLEEFTRDIASFKLKLEHESFTQIL